MLIKSLFYKFKASTANMRRKSVSKLSEKTKLERDRRYQIDKGCSSNPHNPESQIDSNRSGNCWKLLEMTILFSALKPGRYCNRTQNIAGPSFLSSRPFFFVGLQNIHFWMLRLTFVKQSFNNYISLSINLATVLFVCILALSIFFPFISLLMQR